MGKKYCYALIKGSFLESTMSLWNIAKWLVVLLSNFTVIETSKYWKKNVLVCIYFLKIIVNRKSNKENSRSSEVECNRDRQFI